MKKKSWFTLMITGVISLFFFGKRICGECVLGTIKLF
ncbi:hypothetical protein PPSQR21_024520 [Paenibacillus polymyxa SQR-21]|nr:hypothetical protein PPSQR21_024520 [Paenibacillus polymyxa SQR-21]